MFVSDFMQIIAGGELKKTTEFISEIHSDIKGNARLDAGIGAEKSVLPKIFNFLTGTKFNVEVSTDASASRKKDRMAKNILENTLLSDFIAFLEDNNASGIEIFSKIVVKPEINSFSYLMLIAPYLSMINGELPLQTNDSSAFRIDITKIEEAINKGRGYYEFIATIKDKEVILRFNLNSFRNHYTMSDLPKMQLTYYAIKVGEIDKSDLQVQREFNFGNTSQSNRIDYTEQRNNINNAKKMEVYDVVLAGVIKSI